MLQVSWRSIGAAAIGLAFSLATVGCKTGSPDSQTLDVGARAQAAQTEDHAAMVAEFDRGCGRGSCHGGGPTLSYEELTKFASQTSSYYQCFEQRGCFANDLDQGKALDCWACATGSGGLAYNGGIFQASIGGGFIKRIAEAAGKQSDLEAMEEYAMPPGGGAAPMANDEAKYLRLAKWLTQQAGENFAGIRSVREPTQGSNGAVATCDDISPIVQRTYRPTFSLPGVSMFGCRQKWPADPNTCLTSMADSGFANPEVPGSIVRVLRKVEGRRSNYWMRSSPDGRFSSLGNGHIEDLKTAGRSIQVSGDSIDPFYYPDNKFFTWPSMICKMEPLYTASVTSIGTDAPAGACVDRNVEVYGAAGTGDDGEMLVTGGRNYDNNNPGSCYPDAIQFPRGADQTLALRRFKGTEILGELPAFAAPWETDFQMGPSGQLLVGRVMKSDAQQGYRVRAVRPDGRAVDPGRMDSTGVICMKGEKANISFDNRFVAFHHFHDNSAQDQGAAAGSANIFVYDLVKKKGYRVTNMPAGHGAYFPHWRADGWLYFLDKPCGGGDETIMASNIAHVLKAQR